MTSHSLVSKAMLFRSVMLASALLFWAVTVRHHGIIEESDASLMSLISDQGKTMSQAEIRSFMRRSPMSGLGGDTLKRMEATLLDVCHKHRLNPKFVLSVIQIESRFNTWAVSPRGAIGLLQIMPETGEWMAHRLALPWHGAVSLFDPAFNLKLGIEYLGYLKLKYGNDMKAVLSAYNAGPAKFERDRDRGQGRGYQHQYYKNVKAYLLSDIQANTY